MNINMDNDYEINAIVSDLWMTCDDYSYSYYDTDVDIKNVSKSEYIE